MKGKVPAPAKGLGGERGLRRHNPNRRGRLRAKGLSWSKMEANTGLGGSLRRRAKMASSEAGRVMESRKRVSGLPKTSVCGVPESPTFGPIPPTSGQCVEGTPPPRHQHYREEPSSYSNAPRDQIRDNRTANRRQNQTCPQSNVASKRNEEQSAPVSSLGLDGSELLTLRPPRRRARPRDHAEPSIPSCRQSIFGGDSPSLAMLRAPGTTAARKRPTAKSIALATLAMMPT